MSLAGSCSLATVVTASNLSRVIRPAQTWTLVIYVLVIMTMVRHLAGWWRGRGPSSGTGWRMWPSPGSSENWRRWAGRRPARGRGSAAEAGTSRLAGSTKL